MQSNKASTTLPLYLFWFSERCRQLKVHFAGTDAMCNLTKLFGTTSHTWPANGRPAKRVSAVECRPVDDRRLVVGKFMICCNLGAVRKASAPCCSNSMRLRNWSKLRCKKKHWSHSQKRSSAHYSTIEAADQQQKSKLFLKKPAIFVLYFTAKGQVSECLRSPALSSLPQSLLVHIFWPQVSQPQPDSHRAGDTTIPLVACHQMPNNGSTPATKEGKKSQVMVPRYTRRFQQKESWKWRQWRCKKRIQLIQWWCKSHEMNELLLSHCLASCFFFHPKNKHRVFQRQPFHPFTPTCLW